MFTIQIEGKNIVLMQPMADALINPNSSDNLFNNTVLAMGAKKIGQPPQTTPKNASKPTPPSSRATTD